MLSVCNSSLEAKTENAEVQNVFLICICSNMQQSINNKEISILKGIISILSKKFFIIACNSVN